MASDQHALRARTLVRVTTHYFSPDPDAVLKRRKITVTLANRTVSVTTANGMFSPQHIDQGTDILLRAAPVTTALPATGNLLDAGCGWGPMALTMAMLRPEATVYAVDVNHNALEICAENADRLQLSNVKTCRPEDVPEDARFAAIWSNPPIRVGKAVLHEILRTWLPRLIAGGHADLVVQKNLGADSLQTWITTELGLPTERLTTSKGFRLLRSRQTG